jgi:hypothetical protein
MLYSQDYQHRQQISFALEHIDYSQFAQERHLLKPIDFVFVYKDQYHQH